MVEYEKKLLLPKVAYTYLREYFGPYGQTTNHTNYYYDTEKYSLNKINFTLRIREKGGKYVATIKQHTGTPDCNVEISETARDQFDDSFFKAYQVMLHGKLETERLSVNRDSGITIVLDKNNYLDKTDYELEIEYPQSLEMEAADELRSIITVLLESGCIRNAKIFTKLAERTTSKSNRFFSELEKQKITRRSFYDFNIE